MNIDELAIRRGIVLAAALVYWGGVLVQARRVRRHIGRSPNVTPRGVKERLLWLGWLVVVLGWIALPLVVHAEARFAVFRLSADLLHVAGLMAGLLLILTGYAGTLLCYRCMGDHWRMGINREEQGRLVTWGPYAVVRHPLYSFQVLMLAGSAVLLPAPFALLILALHVPCVLIKALDEEHALARRHGAEYTAYCKRTGRLLPRLLRGSRTP